MWSREDLFPTDICYSVVAKMERHLKICWCHLLIFFDFAFCFAMLNCFKKKSVNLFITCLNKKITKIKQRHVVSYAQTFMHAVYRHGVLLIFALQPVSGLKNEFTQKIQSLSTH